MMNPSAIKITRAFDPPDEISNSDALIVRRLDDAVQMPTKTQIVLPEKSGEIFKYAVLEGFTGSG